MATKSLDFESLESTRREDLARLLGVSPQYVAKLVKEQGAPINEDRTYNLSEFLQWVLKWEREKNKSDAIKVVELEKKKQEVRKLKLGNATTEGHLIDREKVDEILNERARALSSFLPRALKENAIEIEMKPRDEIIPILHEVAIQAIEVYIGDRRDQK